MAGLLKSRLPQTHPVRLSRTPISTNPTSVWRAMTNLCTCWSCLTAESVIASYWAESKYEIYGVLQLCWCGIDAANVLLIKFEILRRPDPETSGRNSSEWQHLLWHSPRRWRGLRCFAVETTRTPLSAGATPHWFRSYYEERSEEYRTHEIQSHETCLLIRISVS